METLPALATVAGSYAGYLLAWRRVRVVRGRRGAPDLSALARYDHVALAAELEEVLAADATRAAGARIVPVAGGPLGILPPPWADAPWAHAAPDHLAEVRDKLLLGQIEEAAGLARVAGRPEPTRSLFTWACLHRLFSGELALAAETAEALDAADPGAARLRHRLLARLEAVRAELATTDVARESACAAGLRNLRAARLRAAPPGPAEAGLAAHFEVLRLSLWDLEWRELVARRQLRAALQRHPQAPVLHLVRAHLAARLGDGLGAADHLARALYYARGDAFYARPIAASPFVARVRPALAAEARALLARPAPTGEELAGN